MLLIMNDMGSLTYVLFLFYVTIQFHVVRTTVVVTTSQGKLRGGETKTENGVTYYEFLGVPYAKPPVGNLRFRNTQAPEPWNGERDATVVNKNNICCQLDLTNYTVIGSEDCLYLNVYTPKLPHSDKDLLPVMTFIHGGGFITGTGIVKDELGPDYLIENGVVVVTLNYRLGVLGFLSLDIPEASGNMGLKDQVQALKWIQNNIKKFGGDPHNVTIFGLSAGSASVDYHILSPLSKGLFHKAILHSGSSLNHWAMNYEPKKVVNTLLDKMGFTGRTDDTRAVYDYLLNSSVSNIVEAAYRDVNNLTANRISLGFVPIIENVFGDNEEMITDIPYKLFKEGKFNRVPLIKGFCNMEGSLTVIMKPHLIYEIIEKKNFIDHFSYEINICDRNYYNIKFSEVYSNSEYPYNNTDENGTDFFGDFDIVAGVRLSGEILAYEEVPVYFFEFSYEGQLNFFKNLFGTTRKGAAHGDDIRYLFKVPVSNLADAKDKEIRSNICKMWTNFAKTGDPTSKGIPIKWPKHTGNVSSYLSIGEQFTVKSTYKPRKMDIFKEIYDKYKK